jgi:hypothetical protein
MYKSGYSNRSLIEAFEDNYIPEPNSGCWLWLGAIFKDRGGYGAFTHMPSNTIVQRAHRISWKFFKNPWLNKKTHVLHHCDNPICVNPDHLFEGDQPLNMYDKSMKGRQLQGEKHPHYKHGFYIGDKKNPIYP